MPTDNQIILTALQDRIEQLNDQIAAKLDLLSVCSPEEEAKQLITEIHETLREGDVALNHLLQTVEELRARPLPKLKK